MSKKLKKQLASVLSCVLMAALLLSVLIMPGFATNAEVGYFHNLKTYHEDKSASNWGTFTLTENSRFYIVTGEDEGAFGTEMISELKETVQLASSQFAAAGYPSPSALPVVYGPMNWAKDGDIVVYYDGNVMNDGYKLCVGWKLNAATIQVSSVRGALYGMNTLLKYLLLNDGGTLEHFFVRDIPETTERTVHLDCARKYLSKDWICNFIREMSWMGYNALELHFSEDGGFRMDIWDPKYFSSPTGNDFSWIVGSEKQYWVYNCDDPDQGKYLTAAEMVEILQTARQYQMEVIPSFDTPAHVDWITKNYYRNYQGTTFNYDGDEYTLPSYINYRGTAYESYFSCLDLSNDTVKKFAFALYTDIAAFFKQYAGSTNFNIGGDEVALKSTDSWDYADFITYVNDLNTLLKGQGYTVRMFNDFIERSDYASAAKKTVPALASDIEVVYWDAPNNSSSYIQKGTYFAANRVIYSGVQNWTYYVLRIANDSSSSSLTSSGYFGMDARDPGNEWWSFYRNTEDRIYNEWYPSRLSEYGTADDYFSSKNADGTTNNNLGGAYFFIWNDYAGLNTEQQIWDGVWDSTNTASKGQYFYSLRDRMWANITKMWNWDANSSVDFSNFSAVVDAIGDFPGYTSCSVATTLPAAGEVTEAYLADHSALVEALGTEVDSTIYTPASYSVYAEAFAEAQAVHENHAATQAEVNAAVQLLSDARAQLTFAVAGLTLSYQDESGKEIRSSAHYEIPYNHSFSIQIYSVEGYKLKSVIGGNFAPNTNGGSAGTLTGVMRTSALTVTLIYENTADITPVKTALSGTLTQQGAFSAESWEAYQNAVTALNTFYENHKSDPTSSTSQAEICAELKKLQNAYNQLVIEGDQKELISLKLTSNKVSCGKQAVVVVTTTADIASLTVEGKTLNQCYAQITTDEEGDTVKVWYLTFTVTETAEHTVLADGTKLTTFTVTCG